MSSFLNTRRRSSIQLACGQATCMASVVLVSLCLKFVTVFVLEIASERLCCRLDSWRLVVMIR